MADLSAGSSRLIRELQRSRKSTGTDLLWHLPPVAKAQLEVRGEGRNRTVNVLFSRKKTKTPAELFQNNPALFGINRFDPVTQGFSGQVVARIKIKQVGTFSTNFP